MTDEVIRYTRVNGALAPNTTSTIQLPHNSNVPVITDGFQAVASNYIPLAADRRIRVSAYINYVSTTVSGLVTVTLWGGSICIGAGSQYLIAGNSSGGGLSIVSDFVSANTASLTIQARIGPDLASTITLNSKFGNLTMPYMIIEEYSAAGTTLGGFVSTFLLQDEFVTARAAGSLNGTLPDGTGGARAVTDTQSKLSITSDKLTFAGGKTTPGYGDPGLWYPSMTRLAGLVALIQTNFSVINGKLAELGFDINQAGNIDGPGVQFNSNNGVHISGAASAYTNILPALVASTDYSWGIALRGTAGAQIFRKTGTGHFLLEYITAAGTQTTLFPHIGNYSASFTSDYIRIPINPFLASPVVNDGFGNPFGTTDGLALAEISGLGAGGSGVTWTQQSGTWQTSSGKANASALGGLEAIATTPSPATDVMVTAKLTRTAGEIGIILRYVDSNNFVRCIHDGTNLRLIKRVAGVETTVATSASIAYSANAEIRGVCTGTTFRLYYNDKNIGTGAQYTISDAALQTSTVHGLYTTATGNQFDTFTIFARGSNGEYDNIESPPAQNNHLLLNGLDWNTGNGILNYT